VVAQVFRSDTRKTTRTEVVGADHRRTSSNDGADARELTDAFKATSCRCSEGQISTGGSVRHPSCMSGPHALQGIT